MNMETKLTKVLHNGQKVVVGLKRKREDQCITHVGADHTEVLCKLTSSRNKLTKCKRLDDCKVCQPNSRRSFLRNYRNFSKSGLPQRFMYYEDGDWIDYPQITVEFIREQFQIKNAAIEVELNDRQLLLDALYMIQVDLETGIQRHVAWIDDNGRCFFPEIYSDDIVIHQFQENEMEDAPEEKHVDQEFSSLKIPKSPWMPFSMLFNAISKEVPVEAMKLVNIHYDLFRDKKFGKDEFIKRLRSIVGDPLLRSTLTSLQCKAKTF